MSALHVLDEWLEEIGRDELTVCDDARFEARENLRTLSLSSLEASELSVDELVVFVSNVLELKRDELTCRSLPPMLFYLWFDDVSARLCFSVISTLDPAALDFRCWVNPEAELAPLLFQFLSSTHLEGIPIGELKATDGSESDVSESTEPTYLDVFVCRIP